MKKGMHIRKNKVTGSNHRLNENAVKVLSTVKFSPQSITSEEIMRATNLSKEDVERQIKLLILLRFVKQHSLFSKFPMPGWKVFTERNAHTQIMNILHQHGYEEPKPDVGYHPTGMALEGQGRQDNHGRGYPKDKNGNGFLPINEDLEYKTETIQVMKEWNQQHPFEPKEYSVRAINEKLQKFRWLNDRLADIYGIRKPNVVVGRITAESWKRPKSSGSSSYNRGTHTITLDGKFSVITFLHEFSHSRNFDEMDSVMWSINLFKRIFPEDFAKLIGEGHTLVQRESRFR